MQGEFWLKWDFDAVVPSWKVPAAD